MNCEEYKNGFLPANDPCHCFEANTPLALLDEIGRNLPAWLKSPGFRDDIRKLEIPDCPFDHITSENLPYLRLYYLRLGFLASGFVNQIGQPPAKILPKNIAVPFSRVCKLLNRPSILSYDGYALYNWKRLDTSKPIVLENIDTIQNFVDLFDEHWFILVHVEIESIAGRILSAVMDLRSRNNEEQANRSLKQIAEALWQQVAVLRRIPERMSPDLYFKLFRPYIRFFEDVVFEGVNAKPFSFRGETGAQSSIMPTLVAFMNIKHQPTHLTDHLLEMRKFMPAEHRALIATVEQMPPIRHLAQVDRYNEVLEAMAVFREVHFGWAIEYISKRVDDPRGTGGTPYVQWLKQLIDETRAHMIDNPGKADRLFQSDSAVS